jgi:uncharacterized protein involved in type VI secretion and phage assembly
MDFKAFISDVEYKIDNTYSIREQLSSVSQSSITVLVESQPIPKELQDVVIKDLAGNIIFVGIIQDVESPIFSTTFEVMRYKLEVQSPEVVFNNRLASEAFENKTTTEIVTALFNNYISEEGFTLGEISTFSQNYENYNFQFTKLYDVYTS